MIRIAMVCAGRNCFISRKFEGYIHSGIGSGSVPVGRQAGKDARQNMTSYEFLKIFSGQMLQHLASLFERRHVIVRAVVIVLR